MFYYAQDTSGQFPLSLAFFTFRAINLNFVADTITIIPKKTSKTV